MTFITDDDVEKALDWLRSSCTPAAKARAEKIYLEEYSKSLRSLLMKEFPDLGVAAQEREALSDARYIEHLQGLKEAVEADAKMQFLRQAAMAKIEAWQTMSANERAVKL